MAFHTFVLDSLDNHTKQISGESKKGEGSDADLKESLNLAGLAVPWILHRTVPCFSFGRNFKFEISNLALNSNFSHLTNFSTPVKASFFSFG